MLHRLLPVLILIGLISLGLLQLQPIKREVFYKLGLANDPTVSCCSEEEVLRSKGNFDEEANVAIFNNDIIDYPKTSLAYDAPPTSDNVLGTLTAEGVEKWIEVSLEQQRVRAWEGNKVVMEFPISSGKWAPTPKGDFRIWYKTRRQSMIGGNKALGTYYNLPNVPHNMFFYKGYALHGAYWHNNFGNPMSHGCVNSPLANAAQIFDWAGPVVPEGTNVIRATPENPGTRVFVH